MLLLDEPLGALDLKLRRQMQDELKAIQKRVGTAFVHVTHDQEEAMALADHVVVMNAGRIEDEGTPERVYARPATRFSATFMGESTILAATTSPDGTVTSALGPHLLPVSPGVETMQLAIRPEHVQLGGNIPQQCATWSIRAASSVSLPCPRHHPISKCCVACHQIS